MLATAFSLGSVLVTPIEKRLPTPYKTMRECVAGIQLEAYRHENVVIMFTCIYVEERDA